MIIGITDYYRAPFDIEAEALGGDVEFIDFNSRNEDDFDEDALRQLDALLVYHARITDKTLAKLEKCKIIVRYGVGVVNLDLEALKQRGIPLCNTPNYGVQEIATTAVANAITIDVLRRLLQRCVHRRNQVEEDAEGKRGPRCAHGWVVPCGGAEDQPFKFDG